MSNKSFAVTCFYRIIKECPLSYVIFTSLRSSERFTECILFVSTGQWATFGVQVRQSTVRQSQQKVKTRKRTGNSEREKTITTTNESSERRCNSKISREKTIGDKNLREGVTAQGTFPGTDNKDGRHASHEGRTCRRRTSKPACYELCSY